jgi:hypothetical protein
MSFCSRAGAQKKVQVIKAVRVNWLSEAERSQGPGHWRSRTSKEICQQEGRRGLPEEAGRRHRRESRTPSNSCTLRGRLETLKGLPAFPGEASQVHFLLRLLLHPKRQSVFYAE